MAGNPLGFALSDAVMARLQGSPDIQGAPNLAAPPLPVQGQLQSIPYAPPMSQPHQGISKGQLIAGILADAFMGAAGRPAIVAPMWAAQREREQELAKWGLQRQAHLADYEAQKQIDQRYRPPTAPNEFERALAATGVMPGTPEYTSAMKRRVDNMLNPMMPVPTTDANGNPAYTYVPRNPPGGPATSDPGAVSGPPEAAVQHLRQNPSLKNAFDAKYGPGMADRYLGGGVSNGTGTFPR